MKGRTATKNIIQVNFFKCEFFLQTLSIFYIYYKYIYPQIRSSDILTLDSFIM